MYLLCLALERTNDHLGLRRSWLNKFFWPVVAAGLVCVPMQAGVITPPIWESDYGSSLGLGDDTTTTVNLGFAFPFLGGAYTSVEVSSNGFLSLGGSNGAQCCSGDVTKFLNGTARIALAWFDLYPPGGGAVRFNSFGDRAVFTWDGVPAFNIVDGGTDTNIFQAQLLVDGTIILGYSHFGPDTVGSGSFSELIGVTPGNAASDPGSTDLYNLTVFDTGSIGTIYMLMTPSTTPDFSGWNIVFQPNGQNGWVSSTYAQTVVPEPGTIVLLGSGLALCLILVSWRRRQWIRAGGV